MVKAWTPYTRNGGPASITIPFTIAEAEANVVSGPDFKDTGHTEWPDGRVNHTGFTTAMPPNAKVSYTNGSRLMMYETSVAMLCLQKANQAGKYDAILKKAAGFLKGQQFDEEDSLS